MQKFIKPFFKAKNICLWFNVLMTKSFKKMSVKSSNANFFWQLIEFMMKLCRHNWHFFVFPRIMFSIKRFLKILYHVIFYTKSKDISKKHKKFDMKKKKLFLIWGAERSSRSRKQISLVAICCESSQSFSISKSFQSQIKNFKNEYSKVARQSWKLELQLEQMIIWNVLESFIFCTLDGAVALSSRRE